MFHTAESVFEEFYRNGGSIPHTHTHTPCVKADSGGQAGKGR